MIISGLTSKTKYLKSNKKKVVTVISTQVGNLKAENSTFTCTHYPQHKSLSIE